MKTVFIRVIEADVEDKAAVLREAIRSPEFDVRSRFDVDPATFGVIPKSPFAYWTSNALRDVFSEFPAFASEGRIAKQGLATTDDFRFVRLATEVPPNAQRHHWFPLAKGGRFARFYADVHLVVDWAEGGYEMYAFNGIPFGTAGAPMRNPQYYFRPGLTWPLRGIRFSAQAVPTGTIFSVAGKMAFAEAEELPWLLGLFNSSAFDRFIAFFAGKVGGVQYEVGLVGKMPVPRAMREERRSLAALARRGWSLKRRIDSRTEASQAFTTPALVQVNGATLSERAEAWLALVAEVEVELSKLQVEIDDRCFALYGIDDTERTRIEQGFSSIDDAAEPAEDDDSHDAGGEEIDVEPMVESLLSWALGVAFGRFDVRLATGTCALPAEPKPFEPLPVCSPGMLTGEDGLPLAAVPGGYPIPFPRDGVLVDDLGHPQDLLAHVNRVFEVVFGEHGNERLLEAESHLGRRNEDLRAWFAKRFFAAHVKRYSRSQRKAPIYWQLGTPSASYSVWCYCHRLDGDTFFRLAELVQHKVDHEEGKLNTLRQEAGADPSSKDRRAIDAQESFVTELRAFKDEVERVAPLWNPNLDDGIIIHFALLWRLVPHDKSWQRECKKVWEKLQKGDYDWAHLAMHLWPERVVPKCAKDRSLAIAHGLESEFWFEDEDGKWKPRKAPATRTGELVAERSSSAVKAALGALISAPTQGGAKGRGPKRGGA